MEETTKQPLKLLYICAGNTSRSPMAEVVARHQLDSMSVEIKSAGIDICEGDEYIVPQAASVINEKYGIDLTGRTPVPVTTELLEWADVIIVCGNMMIAEIRIYFHECYTHKTIHYLNTYTSKLSGEEMNNVPDPSDGEWWDDYYSTPYTGLNIDSYNKVLSCMINEWQPALTERLKLMH